MSCACACSISLLAIGMVEAQRGRTPQFVFMKSSASSAVVFGSTVAGLSSGTGGGFTLSHSLVMSFACAAGVANPANASTSTQHDTLARCFMTLLLSSQIHLNLGRGHAPPARATPARSASRSVGRSLQRHVHAHHSDRLP